MTHGNKVYVNLAPFRFSDLTFSIAQTFHEACKARQIAGKKNETGKGFFQREYFMQVNLCFL